KEEKPAVTEKTGVPKADTTINFTVYFDYDQSSLNGNAFKILSDIIALCRKDTSLKILFKGHTDLSGTVESNYRLSLDRANVCAGYLESYLVDKKRIKTEAYSKLQPAVTTNDERLQWMNRRVEVVLYH
ncbi:MAG: OmpA family protein, partial [Bacteroidetes bacterium]|nr:OmpA family protein [Bacteroidota bacterium]